MSKTAFIQVPSLNDYELTDIEARAIAREISNKIRK
jgi:hypothetical protein